MVLCRAQHNYPMSIGNFVFVFNLWVHHLSKNIRYMLSTGQTGRPVNIGRLNWLGTGIHNNRLWIFAPCGGGISRTI